MEFVKHTPPALLKPYVKCFWLFRVSENDIPYTQLLYPYGSHELIFYLESEALMTYINDEQKFAQPRSFYSGQFVKPFMLEFHAKSICVGVSFHPWAGNLLYNIPSENFTNEMVELACLDDNDRIEENLSAAKTTSEIFQVIEQYLLSGLPGKAPDKIGCAIANQIIKCPSWAELNNYLHSNINLSRRRIEQIFLESTGLSMGTFIRKARFQKAINLLQKSRGSLVHTALDAEYYDQANFIKEFKSFSGITPLQFIKRPSELKDFLGSVGNTTP